MSKAAEMQALEQIQTIIKRLGNDSYIGTAIGNSLDVARQNIEEDAAYTFRDRVRMECQNEFDEERMGFKETIGEYEKKIAKLEAKLEKEQEWEPFVDKREYSDERYDTLNRTSDVRKISKEDAKELISDYFGFDTSKIKIYSVLPIYEINRHKQLRVIGTKERQPLYYATDWNYIAFGCCGYEYEMQDGELAKL